MTHHLDRPVGSDLSNEVFQRRRRLAELTAPQLDSLNQRLYPLPSVLVQRESFISDRAVDLDQRDKRSGGRG